MNRLSIISADESRKGYTVPDFPDVVDTFRSFGKGWQTRVDQALKDWLKTHEVGS